MNTLTEKFSPYKGSLKTRELVRAQIEERWGVEAASCYEPRVNCRTYRNWLGVGYKVKPGEKALKSITIVEKKLPDGSIEKFPKNINLFFVNQVMPINA